MSKQGETKLEKTASPPAGLPRVLVSVLSYNSLETTIETLRSLKRQSYGDYYLLLIDNASDEGLVKRVAREFPELDIRRRPENTGYTGGTNFAMQLACEEGYDYLLISNHDVEVEPHAIESLVETAMSHPDAGVVGGIEFNPQTGQQRASAGGAYAKWFSRLAWKSAPLAKCGEEWQEAFCVHGAFLLLTRKAISGGVRMDENLFMYFDEVDIGFQLQKKGLRTLVDRRVIFKHKRESRTLTPQIGYLMQRNRLYMVRKHGRWFHLLFYVLYSSLFELPTKVVIRSLQGHPGFALSCIAGQLDGLRGYNSSHTPWGR
jgi:GT2 family glycosyltransferase